MTSIDEIVKELSGLMEKATPGPWIAAAGPSSVVGWPIVSQTGRSICRLTWRERAVPAGEAEETKEETRANAGLIVARNHLPAILSALSRSRRMEEALRNGLQLKGGWREAIVELEDHCSEPVRLKNMVAAADQLDDWATQARAAIEESK